ncbi:MULTISPECIES: hypothetical protein [Novosphingobium]|jgi:hypothetical protein|uniref:Uncharacterized protein n=1 Tax=Novosphingobium panipatense TaxID=428991 RepID=A0ABY1QS18_9SPHN|nr:MULTISPECIES: hypothetical protein [Novosphingobium]SMP76072.1 hypothetical protein SAMN06296065_10948 [Novosphingobium panipatense]
MSRPPARKGPGLLAKVLLVLILLVTALIGWAAIRSFQTPVQPESQALPPAPVG